MISPAPQAPEAIYAAGIAVNSRNLCSPPEIRRAVPVARGAAIKIKSKSESTDWRTGDLTGLPIAFFQNWLYEQNRVWRFTDGTLAVLWSLEFPHARCDYAEKHRYVDSTRREYNADRHQAPAPETPSMAYDENGQPIQISHFRTSAITSKRPTVARSVRTRGIAEPAAAEAVAANRAIEARPTLRFRTHPEQTRRRLLELDQYIQSDVLDSRGFACSTFAECRAASHTGIFYEGQLHHVGAHYDVSLNDRPFRIAVVGPEYGNGPARVSLDARTRDVAVLTGTQKRFRSDGVHEARNPHMRGTTSVLRLLFGLGLGADHQGEFFDAGGTPVHIFEAFGLTNFLLCSAIGSGEREIGSKPGRSTRTMQRNCARHFRSAMEILEPTVLIVQGRGIRNWLESSLDGVHPVATNLELARIGRSEVIVASFTHPSVPSRENWGIDDRRPYLVDVVMPTVTAVHAEVLKQSSAST